MNLKVKELIMTWAKLVVEEHKAFFELGIDMIFCCDDHAYKGRTMISPKNFEEFVEREFRSGGGFLVAVQAVEITSFRDVPSQHERPPVHCSKRYCAFPRLS